MSETPKTWDYLIVTASNDFQARAYESQLAARRRLGLLPGIGEALVVADPGGKRVGSGGSTIFCLLTVLERELKKRPANLSSPNALENILRQLRILIIHAGGDSRRLPVYGPCGKIFVPVPGEWQSELSLALFDRQLPIFSALPGPAKNVGQVVVTAGDALIRFNAAEVRLADIGMTALGCYATPDAASKHGVFCPLPDGQVRLYLQKPKPEEQQRLGAINDKNQSILDIGVMSFDAATAMAMLRGFGVVAQAGGSLAMDPKMEAQIYSRGLDIYREVCCAMGTEATVQHHQSQVHAAGSTWDTASLAKIYQELKGLPFFIQVLEQCSFLHFGTTRQLIQSGHEMVIQDKGSLPPDGLLVLNNQLRSAGKIQGTNAWVEACRITAPVQLAGENVVVNVDIDAPLTLAAGECLDVVEGLSRQKERVFFVRPHGIKDTFKDVASKGGTFCGLPLLQWLEQAGIQTEAVWDAEVAPAQRSLWDARVFPAVPSAADYQHWLWMLKPGQATPEQKAAFQKADRYSSAEIALLANQDSFYRRRTEIRRNQ
jgi:fucokinase